MNKLPEGWTVEEPKEESKLPEGWKVEKTLNTPTSRDEAKLKKEAGVYAVEEKTPEEIKNMTLQEKMDYLQDLNRQGEYLASSKFTKEALSGSSFGFTENADVLKPTELEESDPFGAVGILGNVTGSLLPLSKIIGLVAGPAAKLAVKSPVFQKQIGSLLTMFGAGATDKALHQVAKGEMPTAEDVLEHGTEWALLDAGLGLLGFTGRFIKNLLTRSKATGLPRKNIIKDITGQMKEAGVDMSNPEKVAEAAMEIIQKPITEAEIAAGKQIQLAEQESTKAAELAQEAIKPEAITPKDLKTRKITDEPVNKLTKQVRNLSEAYQPVEVSFKQEAESLAKDEIAEMIESVGTKAASEENLGNSIREDIETNLEALKSEYRPLYQAAEEAADIAVHVPQKTSKEAGEKLIKMSRLKTKPAGYDTVLKNLENVLEDAGFTIQRENGVINQIISKKEVPVSDTIELARRLNEMVDYEAIEPTVKEALRSVARAAKQDIRAGLAGNAEGLAAFEMAEAEHGRVAGLFGKDSVRKIRGQQAGEKIAKLVESPTALGDLKQVLSPQQMQQVEREMLEKLNAQSFEKAQKTLRETEQHLSAENRKIARDIVESKNPHNPLGRRKIAQEGVLNDISNAFTTGTRPDKTLNIWKTTKGQKLVKDAFKDSPNWNAVKGYLEKQSFNDMVSSVLKDGKLDLKKFKSFMENPAAVNNIREQGGEEAVTFFKNLDSQVKKLEQNTRLINKLPSKDQIEKGRKFIKESPGQRRLEEGVKEKQKLKTATDEIGQREIKPKDKPDKVYLDAKRRRGDEILKRMAQKDYPVQASIDKWKEFVKEMLGLNAQAAMNVFGIAKLGSPLLGAYTFGIPYTVASMVGYTMMNKMMTSPRVRKAFLEATKQQTNPMKFIMAWEAFGESLEDD